MNCINTHRPNITLTTVQLRKLCDQSEELRFSNGPNDEFWQKVDPNGVHVVEIWFVHRPRLYLWKNVDHPWNFAHGGGKNIRAFLNCKMLGSMEPQDLLCDFDYTSFLKIVRRSRKVRSRRRKLASAK